MTDIERICHETAERCFPHITEFGARQALSDGMKKLAAAILDRTKPSGETDDR